MKKFFITLCAVLAVCVAGFSAYAAESAIYICGAINNQGWQPGPSAIKLTTITDGWFKLDVTKVGEFKVSTKVGSTDDDWTTFNGGCVHYALGTKALNATYNCSDYGDGNSSVPAGTKAIYFSSDLKKAAISDGTWAPEAYTEQGGGDEPLPGGEYYVKVDVTIPGWTNVNCFYWGGGAAPSWPGVAMTSEGNNIWKYTFDHAPSMVIFNNGTTQTVDLEFENGKTYVLRSQDPNQQNYWCEASGDEPDPTPGDGYTIDVNVAIPGWSEVYCHYWGGAAASSWPGVKMTDKGGNIWTITLPKEPGQVLFHNGNNDQSIDFAFTDGKTYVLRSKNDTGKWTEENGGGDDPDPIPGDDYYVKVDVSVPGWTNVNCYYWGGTATAPAWPGKAMTSEGGNIWKMTFSGAPANVIFGNGSEQTVDLEFVNGKTYVLRSTVYDEANQMNKWTEEKDAPVQGLSNTLPVLYINIYQTNDDGSFKLDAAGNKIFDNYQLQVEEIDKKYRSGEYWLDMNGCTTVPGQNVGSADEPLPLEMKGRGNWTRKGFAKKPFKLKLGKKQTLLGMGDKSKHWAILAHADDNYGYMRNFTGFSLGQRMGLPWTPSQQPVEVVINGNYRGLYFLTESIRVGDGRVPIAELNDNETDPTLISGGYLVELDNYDETNQIQLTEQVCPGANPPMVDMLRVTWDTPEEYSDIQQKFVREQFTAMNNLVGKANTSQGNDLWAYLDLDDAARYYVVMEICSHTEAYHGSTYLFRDRGEGQKWHFSPLWDMGNAFNGPTNNYFYTAAPFGTTWLPSMRCNQKFMEKVKESWLWFMNQCYDGFMADLDTYATTIAEAAKADHKRWGGQPTPAGGQEVCDNSDIQARKAATKQRINDKLNWLKNQWGDYNNGFFAEPERDTTPAAKLPEYVTGLGDIIIDTDADAGATPVYYNLQGIRVDHPAAGSVYIEVRGTRTRKAAF